MLRRFTFDRASSRPYPNRPRAQNTLHPRLPLLPHDDGSNSSRHRKEKRSGHSTGRTFADHPEKETGPRGTHLKHEFSACPCAWPRESESKCQVEFRGGFKQAHPGNRRSRRLYPIPPTRTIHTVRTLMAAPFETDQKWARPAVKPFDPTTDSLSISISYVGRLRIAFQQIESEEAMDGTTGEPTIRLFGVTDVPPHLLWRDLTIGGE